MTKPKKPTQAELDKAEMEARAEERKERVFSILENIIWSRDEPPGEFTSDEALRQRVNVDVHLALLYVDEALAKLTPPHENEKPRS